MPQACVNIFHGRKVLFSSSEDGTRGKHQYPFSSRALSTVYPVERGKGSAPKWMNGGGREKDTVPEERPSRSSRSAPISTTTPPTPWHVSLSLPPEALLELFYPLLEEAVLLWHPSLSLYSTSTSPLLSPSVLSSPLPHRPLNLVPCSVHRFFLTACTQLGGRWGLSAMLDCHTACQQQQ